MLLNFGQEHDNACYAGKYRLGEMKMTSAKDCSTEGIDPSDLVSLGWSRCHVLPAFQVVWLL